MAFWEIVQREKGLYYKNRNKKLLLCALIFLLSPLTLWGQVQRDSLRAEQLLNQGLERQSEGLYLQANELLTQAAALFQHSRYPFKAAQAYNHASSNFRLAGKLDSAEANALKALQAISDLPLNDPTEPIRSYTNLGLIETLRARFDSSLEWLGKAYHLLSSPSVSPFLKTTVLGSMGYVLDDIGDYDQALKYYYESLEILTSLETPPKGRIAKLYNNIGYTYSNLGLYERASSYYKKELELGLQIKDDMHPDVAIAHINIGSSYYRRGDCGQAVLYFQKSLEAALNAFGNDHEMIYKNYDNLALCYLEMEQYDRAIASLERSADMKMRMYGRAHPALAATYLNQGRVYARQKRYRQALAFSKRALNIQRRSLGERHPKLVDSYNKTGTYFAHYNQPDSAFYYLNKAQELGQTVLDSRHPILAQTLAAMAKASESNGQFQKSGLYYQQALQLLAQEFRSADLLDNPKAATIAYPTYAVDILFDKAQMLRSAYASEGGTAYLRASLSTFHALSLLLDHLQAGFINKQSKLAIGKKSHRIYEHAIQTAYDLYQEENKRDYLEQIFFFSEKGKARLMLESVAKKGIKQYAGIPDSLLQYERSLEGKINAIHHEMNLLVSEPSSDSRKPAVLRDSLITLNQQLSAYTDMLVQQYPRYHAVRFASHIPSLSYVQQQLDERNLTVLEYYLGEHSLFAMLITRNSITVQKLPKTDRSLAALIDEFNASITSRDDASYQVLGHDLYQILVEPLEPYISSATQLLVVPDGEIALLPFEALLTRSVSAPSPNYKDLPYMLRDYTVAYAPSVTLSASLRAPHNRIFETDFLAFAPGFITDVPRWQDQSGIVSRSTWNPLPFSKIEVTNIAALFRERQNLWDYLFGAEKAQLLLDKRASEPALKVHSGLDARYIHLATHAFVSEEQSEVAGILLYPDESASEDGILYAHEIYNLSMNTELVVLSACDTGRGSVVKGEGIMSLSRAFRYAGAENILVTLWKVQDRSSAKLMVEFYQSLIENTNMSEALQVAKRTLVQEIEFAHPYYWASFTLIG